MHDPRVNDLPRRPLVGVTGRRKRGSQISGFPGSLADLEFDVYVSDYGRGVLEAGGLPLHLPLDAGPLDLLDHVDGLVLTGGADIDPSLWGAPCETDEFPPESSRDRFELALAREAAARSLPVLGICRGMQLLNVSDGGSLHQHVPSHARFDGQPSTVAHELTVAEDTLLARLCGDRVLVNSLHHQTVDRLGTGWSVSATASDGTIEAIEKPGATLLGVQWHPEMLVGRATDPLFTWIVDEAAAHRSRRTTAAAS